MAHAPAGCPCCHVRSYTRSQTESTPHPHHRIIHSVGSFSRLPASTAIRPLCHTHHYIRTAPPTQKDPQKCAAEGIFLAWVADAAPRHYATTPHSRAHSVTGAGRQWKMSFQRSLKLEVSLTCMVTRPLPFIHFLGAEKVRPPS